MAKVGALFAAVLLVSACATDAPDRPSPYPPTIKPAPSKLVFGGAETCDDLAAKFERARSDEGYFAKQAAVMHYELGLMTVLTLGAMPFALDKTARVLAEARGDMIAIRDEIVKRGCDPAPKVVFSSPSARTVSGSYFH